MAIDLAAVILLLLGVIHGWRSGMMAQVLGGLTLLAVWLLAPRIVPPLRAWLLAHDQTPGVGLEFGCLGAAVALVLMAAFLIISVIPAAVRSWSERAAGIDRGLGALVGALRAVLLLWLLLATTAWAEPVLVRQVPELRAPLRDSQAIATARTYNVWRLVELDALQSLRLRLARGWQPDERAPMALRVVMADVRLQAAARAGDLRELLADRRVAALLADRAFATWLRGGDGSSRPESAPPAHSPALPPATAPALPPPDSDTEGNSAGILEP